MTLLKSNDILRVHIVLSFKCILITIVLLKRNKHFIHSFIHSTPSRPPPMLKSNLTNPGRTLLHFSHPHHTSPHHLNINTTMHPCTTHALTHAPTHAWPSFPILTPPILCPSALHDTAADPLLVKYKNIKVFICF